MSAATVSRARNAAARGTATRGVSAVPRRVSGPVGGRVRVERRPQPAVTAGARALAVVRSLPDHSVIDRLVRGRAWIPVLGVLLVGIVAMQVEILKAGTTLGRSLERTASLQSQNESLQAGVAGLADYQRIERLATGMGMVMPSPGLLTFVTSKPQAQLGAGLANIRAPDPTGFASQLASQVAAAELVAPSTATASTPSSQSAGTQSAATSGPNTSAAAVGSTTAVPSGTTAGATGSTTSGSTATTTSPPAPASAGTTGGTASTSGAPAATVTPTASAGASGGAAGLPITSTSQSGSPSGG